MITNDDKSKKLNIVIPGFGGPHIENKLQILQSNLEIIKATTQSYTSIDITIYVYDREVISQLTDDLLNDCQITWILQKGVIGEFLMRYTDRIINKSLDSNEYILILLDDVELQKSVDFDKILQYMSDFKFDILSPCLTHNSKYQFNYMLQIPTSDDTLLMTNACELFCYFMKYSAYMLKYYPMIEKENPWLWGMDMMLYTYFHLKVGIINSMTMIHHYKNEAYQSDSSLPNPFIGQAHLFKKYNTSMDELSKQKAIRYIIYDV